MHFKKCFSIAAFLLISICCFAQDTVITYSGNGSIGFRNGAVDSATYNGPFGMCLDKNHNLYIADDGNNSIRMINTTTGQVSTLAGTGKAGWKDGPADSAQFSGPADVCVDDSGNVYVSDFGNQRIRKISFNGIVSTIAGTGAVGYVDGSADSAEFDYPRGICRDTSGNLYVADSWNHRIRRITPSGVVSTFAGGGIYGLHTIGDYVDANDTNARFYTPSGLTIDPSGNIYVADAYNNRVRKIDHFQNVTTVVGNGPTGIGTGSFEDGDTSVAILNVPTEVFFYADSSLLYISDTYNNRIRKLDMNTNWVSTVAGSDSTGFVNNIDSLSAFNFPRGLVADTGGRIYVADFSNNAIRLIQPVIISTGITETMTIGFNVFPNPSNGIFALTGIPTNVTALDIIDETGRIIKSQAIEGLMNLMVDLSSFPKGIYLLRLSATAGNVGMKKVVVE